VDEGVVNYEAMRRTALDIQFTNRTGLCPVCRKAPSGWWPDGTQRATCGSPSCFRRWVPGGGGLSDRDAEFESLPKEAADETIDN
jgi:hypothetical protein